MAATTEKSFRQPCSSPGTTKRCITKSPQALWPGHLETNGIELLVMNSRAGVVKSYAVVLVVDEGQMRVTEITVSSCFAPTRVGAVEVESKPLDCLLTREMQLVNAFCDAKSINAFIGNGHGWIPSPVTLPILPETCQAISVHASVRTIAVDEQRRAEAQQMFVPLKAARRTGKSG